MTLIPLKDKIYTRHALFVCLANSLNKNQLNNKKVNYMEKFKNCIRCNSQNIDKVMVNTRINLNYPEQENIYGGATQRVINPTNAIVCADSGHIEMFIDWTLN